MKRGYTTLTLQPYGVDDTGQMHVLPPPCAVTHIVFRSPSGRSLYIVAIFFLIYQRTSVPRADREAFAPSREDAGGEALPSRDG